MSVNEVYLDNYSETDEYIGSAATDDQYDSVISTDTDIYINGELSVQYRVMRGEALSIIKHLTDNSKYTSGKRTNGLRVNNAIYGAMPRNPVRCNWCRVTPSSYAQPKLYALAVRYAELISEYYPDFDMGVDGDWLMGDSKFTTLNINKNHAIKHHRDSGNIDGMMSNVFIYRSGVKGGRLVLPFARLAAEQKSGAFIRFYGNKITHGVTAIEATSSDSVRASAVLYTMKEMRNCLPMSDELKRCQNKNSEIAREIRNGSPKLRKRYAKKIAEAESDGRYNK